MVAGSVASGTAALLPALLGQATLRHGGARSTWDPNRRGTGDVPDLDRNEF